MCMFGYIRERRDECNAPRIVLHKNGLRKQRAGLLIPGRMTMARDDLISFDSSQ